MAGPKMIARKPFYFLRYGETEHNAKQILSGGDSNISLNSCGFKQAQEVRPYIQGLPIQVIYHSPLVRAKHLRCNSGALKSQIIQL